MKNLEHNPYASPDQQPPTATENGSLHLRNAIKTSVIGPLAIFPVFTFIGAVHGLNGLFGGPTHYGMEGAKRGLFFAAFITMTVIAPVILAVLSAAVGFCVSLLVGHYRKIHWATTSAAVALSEYLYLMLLGHF